MFTLNTNDKLGMMVEDARMGEIRDAIAAQRLGDEVRNATSEHNMISVRRWIHRVRILLVTGRQRLNHQPNLQSIDQPRVTT